MLFFLLYNISLRAAVLLKVNSIQCYLHMGKTRRFMYDYFWFVFHSIRMCIGQNLEFVVFPRAVDCTPQSRCTHSAVLILRTSICVGWSI